jgi:hypothetical protein
MKKQVMVYLIVALAAICTPIAFSQMGGGQAVVYTYVSQFQVPRASWAQYSESTEKWFVPIADKAVADGTILSYSTFETLVHTSDGYTHGAAWSSSTISGLTKLLEELRKGGPQAGQVASTKHEDFLMQSSLYAIGSGTPAYLRVVCQNAKPGKAEEFTASMKKYIWPMVEAQIKAGAVSYVGLDSQYVNTSAPSTRCLVINFPNAEGMDKWAAAVNANFGKLSRAEMEAFYAPTVDDSRRDLMARITHSGAAHK